jgi:hypothetical protein
MKNIIKLLLIVLVSLLSVKSNAQIFRIIGGLNLSNMLVKNDVDTYSNDFKMNPGFHIGATIEFPLSNVLSLSTGLTIDTKGFRIKEEGQDWMHKEKLNLYYLDIPIVLKATHDFESGIKIFGVVGPYIGVGLIGKIKNEYEYQGEKETDKIDVEWGNDENEDFFRRFDSGLTFGGGVEFKAILIGISYDLGLYNISPTSNNGFKMNNRVLRLSIGYRLGNKN